MKTKWKPKSLWDLPFGSGARGLEVTGVGVLEPMPPNS